MSAADPGTPSPPVRRIVLLPWWTVGVAAALAVLARLPFLGHAPGPDESGFLLVGAQWNGPGPSLYSEFWVDRPPLLITIFRVASELGGLTALRLIGCLAVLLVVVGSARVAALLAGPQAARWTAVVAAALCLSPLLGGYAVNGEILAAPFIVGGLLMAVAALHAHNHATAAGFAGLAAVFAVCSVLIKQNLADVAVFAFVAYVAAWILTEITRQRFLVLVAGSMAGALASVSVASAWTTRHGTPLDGVFDAMYPFRLRAAEVIARTDSTGAAENLSGLLGATVISGIGVLLVLLGRDVFQRQRRNALTWALLATLLFAATSVLLGGSYWHHYLIELIAPVAIAVGVVTVEGRRRSRTVIIYAAVAAVVAWGVTLALPSTGTGETVGTAIKDAAEPGDSLVVAFGHPDIVLTSGLRSPYEYLWSLPARTLDPELDDFYALLVGPEAPTWLVLRPIARTFELPLERIDRVLARDYREVAQICGLTVLVRADVERAAPRRTTECSPTGFLFARAR